MPLSARVHQIPPITVIDLKNQPAPLYINCHQATCYWLYHEAKNEPPMGWAFVDTSFSNTTDLMTEMAKHGKLIGQSYAGNIQPGDVLIFTDSMGHARHSCVINGTGQIGGYNQQSWFTSVGTPNQFSTHAIAHIRWRRGKQHKVLLSNGAKGKLFVVNETTAVSYAKFKF